MHVYAFHPHEIYPPGTGFAIINLTVGSYLIAIKLSQIDDDDISNDEIGYKGEGELTIERIDVPKPQKTLFDPRSQQACFNTPKAVKATPENICKAIMWCKQNPDFLKER